MKNSTIIEHIKAEFCSAEVYSEDNSGVWFLMVIVSSKALSRVRVPYWQILPYDGTRILLHVWQKF